MKLVIKIIILLFFSNVQSQNKISCDSIKKGIIDKKLYDTLENGKVIFLINLNKNKVFLIRNKINNKYYYVTKKLMKKIKKFKCDNIVIEELKSVNDKEAPKIVRD